MLKKTKVCTGRRDIEYHFSDLYCNFFTAALHAIFDTITMTSQRRGLLFNSFSRMVDNKKRITVLRNCSSVKRIHGLPMDCS